MVAKERGDKMNLYQELAFLDVLQPIKNKYKIEFDEEGRPKIFLKASLDCDTPWISNCREDEARRCNLWGAYFNYGIISQGCLNCYKIVMTIPTLNDLFQVLTFQKGGALTCKCGIERRRYIGKVGKYGAYWYAPLSDGLEEGRSIYKDIKAIFPEFPLILKRGCTEFEMMYNPSSKWEQLAKERGWADTEQVLDSIFVADPMALKVEMNTPELLETTVIRRWVEYAFEHGDETYLEFTDGQKLKIDLETYHEEGNNANSGSAEAAGFGDNRLGGSADEDSGVETERNSSIIQGLPDD
jgi:hypothetical protein